MGQDDVALTAPYQYLSATLVATTGLSASNIQQLIQNSSAVTDFVEDGTCMLLVATHSSTATSASYKKAIDSSDDNTNKHIINGGLLFFSNSIEETSQYPNAATYLFVKSSNNEILTEKTLQEIKSSLILIASPPNSDLFSTLRSSLDSVYAPLIQNFDSFQNDSEKKGDDSRRMELNLTDSAKHLVVELERELTFTTKAENSSCSNLVSSSDIHDTSCVRTPLDEILFWKSFQACDAQYADSVSRLNSLFSEIEGVFQRICTCEKIEGKKETADNDMSILATMDWIESEFGDRGSVEGALYDAFLVRFRDGQFVYSTKRMVHLIQIIGNSLCSYISSSMSDHSWLFLGPPFLVKRSIQSTISALKSFKGMILKLTTIDLATIEGRSLAGKTIFLGGVDKIIWRLEEICGLRSAYAETFNLLSAEQRSELVALNAFEPFIGVDALNTANWASKRFEGALYKHKCIMGRVAHWVNDKLEFLIDHHLDTSPLAVSSAIKRHISALQLLGDRKVVKSSIDAVLSKMKNILNTTRQNLDDIEDQINANPNEVQSTIADCRQFQFKVGEIRECCVAFGGKDVLKEILAECEAIDECCKQVEGTIQQTWARHVTHSIDSGVIKLQTEERLIETDKEGMLKVNFDRMLCSFSINQQFVNELGFAAPTAAVHVLTKASKRQLWLAIVLDRISSFYNSLEDYIIPSQRPMLLETLVSFEKILLSQASSSNPINERQATPGSRVNKVTWSNFHECERFIDKIHKILDRLKVEMKELRSIHVCLAKKTSRLTAMDLLTQKKQWMEQCKDIERTVKETCQNRSQELVSKWMKYWDMRLYEALEASYRRGLPMLRFHFADFSCSLIADSGKICFDPDIATLKTNFITRTKAFIDFPKSKFKGITGLDIFGKMKQTNADLANKSLQEAEELISMLDILPRKYSNWLVIFSRDRGFPVRNGANTFKDCCESYDFIDKMQEDLESIPDCEFLENIKVSLTELKRQIRGEIDSFRDRLNESLIKNLSAQVDEIKNYLVSSASVLTQSPTTLLELSESQKSWKEIVKKKEMYQGKAVDCRRKLNLIKERLLVDTSDLSDRIAKIDDFQGESWTTLNLAISQFSDLIVHKKEFASKSIAKESDAYREKLASFRKLWKSATSHEFNDLASDELEVISSNINSLSKDFSLLESEARLILETCHDFQIQAPDLEVVNVLKDEVKSVQQRSQHLLEYSLSLDELRNKKWTSFQSNLSDLDDFVNKWSHAVKDWDDTAPDLIIHQLKMLESSIPALRHCRVDLFREDHWVELLQGKLHLPGSVRVDNLYFSHFMQSLEILATPDAMKFTETLAEKCRGEVIVRETLNEFIAWYQTYEIDFYDHTYEGRYTPLIQNWKQIFIEINDKQNLLSTLSDSHHAVSLKDALALHQSRLNKLDSLFHLINDVQRRWVVLVPIYLKKSLPSEHDMFAKADAQFRSLMKTIEENPKVCRLIEVESSSQTDLAKVLGASVVNLERYQKALNEFLEGKRLIIPRFYFVGNNDLLEILGIKNVENIGSIQPHLKSLFQGIVQINVFNGHIVSFQSSVGELVQLSDPVHVTERPEVWFAELVQIHKNSLSELLTKCMNSIASDKLDIFPSQILDLSEGIAFSSIVEKSIETKTSFFQLKEMFQGKLHSLTRQNTLDSNLVRSKKNALILDILRFLDVIDDMAKNRVHCVSDWAWQKQLRYYRQNECFVRMSDTTFGYSFEYQGCQPKLVYTPLTDKCYLNLCQALKLGFGGNPIGPAGTGKTESVKALGAALGRHVLVFNCDDGINTSSMGRMFIGIVCSGAWGCFDEFNRLSQDQLSAVSHQIHMILVAIKEKKDSVRLLGNDVKVNANAGIFVTLNPASKDYKGRSELPANLKALFRPIAMSKPDNVCIADVTLLADGFSEAKILSQKLVLAFSKLQQLLSKQRHYDWGLRALKAVLRTACKMLRSAVQGEDARSKINTESSIIVRALEMNILPKLSKNDVPLFSALISDIFVEADFCEIYKYDDMKVLLSDIFQENKLEFDDFLLTKVIQLKEILKERIGCIISGPSCSGKSVIWEMLRASNMKAGMTVKIEVLSPKSMAKEVLLGGLDCDTREWKDGILISAARNAATSDSNYWIVCDGDIDPEWVEGLNSVLDDNKILTLPNGERITFGDNVNFIFETHDLSYVSPATISRVGMLHINEEMDARPIISTWIKKRSNESREMIEVWIKKYFDKALSLRNEISQIVSTSQASLIQSALSYTENALDSEKSFLLRLAEGFGSNMKVLERRDFIKHVTSLYGESHVTSPLRKEDSLAHHNMKGKSFSLASSAIDALRYAREWVARGDPFLLIGPQGCGKETVIDHACSNCRGLELSTFHCDKFTQPSDLLKHIKRKCVLDPAFGGQVYRPRASSKLIIVVKDVDLIKTDEYGTCSTVSLLQFILKYGGFHSNGFVRVERIQFAFTINGTFVPGRHLLCKRFTSLLHITAMDCPTGDDLLRICLNLLEKLSTILPLSDFRALDQCKLATVMKDTFEEICNTFPNRLHGESCLFSLRTFCSWVRNLEHYNLDRNPLDCVLHEGLRLFCDPLRESNHKMQVQSILDTSFKKNYGCSILDIKNIHFSNINQNGTFSPNDTVVRMSSGEMANSFAKGMELYSRTHGPLSFHLHSLALEQISSISHALIQNRCNAVLIGSAGTGRRNKVRLLCFLGDISFCTPYCTTGYNIDHFKKEIKNILFIAGMKNDRICLYIEDRHICSPYVESFVSRLLLSPASEIFDDGELDLLLSQLHNSFSEEEGISPTQIFDKRVSRNLRVVFSVSPTSDVAKCISDHPAFLRTCSVVHFDRASDKQLQEILTISRVLDHIALVKESFPSNIQEKIDILADAAIKIHRMQSAQGACDSDFYSFLGSWRKISKEMMDSKRRQLSRMQSGLSLLQSTNREVESMKADAKEQKLLLETAQADADAAMNAISDELSKSQIKSNEIEQLKLDLAEKSQEAFKRKASIQDEIESIQPVLDAAKEAVSHIDKSNLDEIRSLKTPPSAIVDVLSGVLMLLGIEDLTWMSMKKFLGQRGVKDNILNFDAKIMSPEVVVKVEAIVKKKSQSFDAAAIKKVSAAASPLAAWVRANLEYARVLKKVKPLEAKLESAENELQQSQFQLDSCESELFAIDRNVEDLRIKFRMQIGHAELLKENIRASSQRLDTAQALLDGLKGESKRWQEEVSRLEVEIYTVHVESLLFSGFINYLSARGRSSRDASLRAWLNFFKTDFPDITFDLACVGASEMQLSAWHTWGLPSDQQFVENAIIICQLEKKVPYLVDPSGVALGWLKEYYSQNGGQVEFSSISDESFYNVAILCVKFGKTLVVTDCEGMPSILYPLMRRDVTVSGGRTMIEIGDRSVDFNDNFILVVVSTSAEHDIAISAKGFVSPVVFNMSQDALENEILDLVVRNEIPETEERLEAVRLTEKSLRLDLIQLEDNILETLSTADGNLLENKGLLQLLQVTKDKVSGISDALSKSEEASSELCEEKDKFRSFAQYASNIFTLVQNLGSLKTAYQFSLEYFFDLIKKIMNTPSSDHEGVEGRSDRLCSSLLKHIVSCIGKSLFKEDRLTFIFHILHGMMPKTWGVAWEYLLGHSISMGLRDEMLPSWVPEDRKYAYAKLQECVPAIFERNNFESDEWRSWAEATDPSLSLPKSSVLNSVEYLLLIHSIRPDYFVHAISAYCIEEVDFPTSANVTDAYRQARENSNRPILFISLEESDPSSEIEDFASSTVGLDSYTVVAMAKDQLDISIASLRECSKNGSWLCLTNLHLVVEWLPTLAREWRKIKEGKVHEDFQLWLVAEHRDGFSKELLECSEKVVYESPQGLRQNMLRLYSNWESSDVWSRDDLQNTNIPMLHFALAWTHCLLQERSWYNQKLNGSNIIQYGRGDLKAAELLIRSQSDEYDSLRHLMKDIVYGGKVDDPVALRLISTCIDLIFSRDTVEGKKELMCGVSIPASSEFTSHINTISKIPIDFEDPGLPLNTKYSLEKSKGDELIKKLKQIEFDVDTNDVKNSKAFVNAASSVVGVWKEYCRQYQHASSENSEKKSDGHDGKHSLNPLEVFLRNERHFGESLFTELNEWFSLIGPIASDDVSTLTETQQRLCKVLVRGDAPDHWQKLWEGPKDPKAWLHAFFDRFFASIERNDANKILEAPVRLSQFFFPDSLLGALHQHSCRVEKCSMSDLRLTCSFNTNSSISSYSTNSIVVEGIYIQGAIFKETSLSSVDASSPQFSTIPPLTITFIPITEPVLELGETLSVPVFVSLWNKRTVLDVSLPCVSENDRRKWILSGVSLFTDIA